MHNLSAYNIQETGSTFSFQPFKKEFPKNVLYMALTAVAGGIFIFFNRSRYDRRDWRESVRTIRSFPGQPCRRSPGAPRSPVHAPAIRRRGYRRTVPH